MTKEEVYALAKLARIGIQDAEATALQGEISSILSYVSQISALVREEDNLTPKEGVRSNIFRSDVVGNMPGSYTEAILQNAPAREGNFLKVKKILSNDE